MALIAPPTGVLKPFPWPVDPLRTAAPELWRGLAFAASPLLGEVPHEVTQGGRPTKAGSPFIDIDTYGRTVNFGTDTDRLTYGSTRKMRDTISTFTMAIVCRPAAAASSSGARGIHWGTQKDHPAGALIYYPSTGSPAEAWEFRSQRGDGTDSTARMRAVGSAGSAPEGATSLVVGRRIADGEIELWQDGVLLATASTANGSGVGNIDTVCYIGDRAEEDRPYRGNIDTLMVWDRSITDSELEQWFADPFAPFRPAERRVAFVAAAGLDNARLADLAFSRGRMRFGPGRLPVPDGTID